MNMGNLVKRVNDYKAIAKKIDEFQGENKRDFQDWLMLQYADYCNNIRALRSMPADLTMYEAMRDEFRGCEKSLLNCAYELPLVYFWGSDEDRIKTLIDIAKFYEQSASVPDYYGIEIV